MAATGKHGPQEVVITIAESPGGTARIITPYVNTISGIGIESITQATNPFGTTSEQNTPVGIDKTADITISGFLDDTVNVGPKAVFFNASNWALDKASASVGRILTILCATGMTFTITVHLVKAELGLKKDGLTEYTATVRQMSAGVWS
jgi:hypothetical protein